MKILVVQESDWLKRNPHQQHHLMERLSLEGHEIRVIDHEIDWKIENKDGIYSKRTVFTDIHKIHDEARIQVIRPGFIKIPILDYFSIFFSHSKEIKKQIDEFKPDIIVGFGILNTYIASKTAKEHEIPFVYYLIDVLYTLIPERYFQALGKYLKKQTIKNSSQIITINKRLAEFAIELGADKNKTSVIEAGLDLERFDPKVDGSALRTEYGIREKDTVIFFMGWIYHFAGLKEVSEELGKSKYENPNIKLLIVGDGDAYHDLLEINEKYNLKNQLILTGKQTYDKIPEFIAASDICILPAYPDEEVMQEIVPIKLYEYMAMEKPVITTRLPGIMKEFGEDDGLIYVDKPQDVLRKVYKLIEDASIRNEGKKARKFVQNSDWKIISINFEKTLEDLI